MARVLVTDAHLGSAVAIIRSLGRRHEVVAAGTRALSAGSFSKHASGSRRYPDPGSDPEATAQALLEIVDEERIDLLVPVTDDVILAICDRRDDFERRCRLALAAPAALDAARDKDTTMRLAARLGLPTPKTVLVHTAAEAREQAGHLGWPVVLKPQASRVFGPDGTVRELSVAYAGGFAGLERHMRAFEGLSPVLLQRYHAGHALGVEMLTHEGRPLAAFQHRRLREVPITGGASAFRESVPVDPVLYGHASRLLGELRWTGLAMVEFKQGDDGPVLMEINGRIWGSLPLAVRSGMDFPAKMAELFLSGPPSADVPVDRRYTIGVRSRHLELDLVWIASVLRRRRRYPFLDVPPRREAIGVGARLLRPADGFDILSSDDPRPGLIDLLRVGTRLPAKLLDAR